MRNSEKYRFSDFTLDKYTSLLKLAKKEYEFSQFQDKGKTNKIIYWRHDLDISLHSARKMAFIENKENVRTTYFIHLHSYFYHFLEKPVFDLVNEVIGMGHYIGLHFDWSFYSDNTREEMISALRYEKRILETYFRTKIYSFSFHDPNDEVYSLFPDYKYCGMVNTYSEDIRKIKYISDSNGYWRFERLEDVLKENKHDILHVLTHPVYWSEKVKSPREKIEDSINGRSQQNKKKYHNALRQMKRKNINW